MDLSVIASFLREERIPEKGMVYQQYINDSYKKYFFVDPSKELEKYFDNPTLFLEEADKLAEKFDLQNLGRTNQNKIFRNELAKLKNNLLEFILKKEKNKEKTNSEKIEKILKNLKEGPQQVITNKNPIPCERLRIVNFPIINFTGQTDKGQVVVLDVLAKHTQIIFDTLYHRKFPINKALLMEKYNGNDNASMNDNNTSAFNGRPITGSSDWSLHAYGVAIDINPLQNPYVAFDDQGRATILPALSAKQTINRLNYRPKKQFRSGMAEDAIEILAENGFIGWGGYWDYPIDYQHFEIGSRKFVQQLVSLCPCKAQKVFDHYAKSYVNCMAKSSIHPHAAARAACVAKIIQ